MALKLRAAAKTVHSGAEQKLKTRTVAEGGTTNVHKARSDSPDPPDPPPSGVLGKTPHLRGFVFVDSAPPLDRAARWTGSSLRIQRLLR